MEARMESIKERMSAQGMQLILGSSSKWRKEVLKELGFTFTCMSPDIDEKGTHSSTHHYNCNPCDIDVLPLKAIRDTDPHVMTVAIAAGKADELKRRVRRGPNPNSDPNTIFIVSTFI
jgi:hypothetical protein